MTRYSLKCKCGAFCSVPGEDHPETNATEYDLDDAEWEGGSPDCPHDDFECVDVSYDDTDDWHGDAK